MSLDLRKEANEPRAFPFETTSEIGAAIGGPQAKLKALTFPGPPTSILEINSNSSSIIFRILIEESSHPTAKQEEERDAARAKIGGRVGSVDYKIRVK